MTLGKPKSELDPLLSKLPFCYSRGRWSLAMRNMGPEKGSITSGPFVTLLVVSASNAGTTKQPNHRLCIDGSNCVYIYIERERARARERERERERERFANMT